LPGQGIDADQGARRRPARKLGPPKSPIEAGESPMSKMLKVIEVLAESDKSWEDAAIQAVATASETLHGVKSLYVKNFEAKVEEGKIVKYRINANISFLLD
jgi:flavin-binding protein dodecin